jgi:hypothetical protein
MSLLQRHCLIPREPVADLPPEGLNQQAATHADAPMNAPDGERKPGFFEGFMPCENMLIHAVDERTVEIKEEGGTAR